MTVADLRLAYTHKQLFNRLRRRRMLGLGNRQPRIAHDPKRAYNVLTHAYLNRPKPAAYVPTCRNWIAGRQCGQRADTNTQLIGWLCRPCLYHLIDRIGGQD